MTVAEEPLSFEEVEEAEEREKRVPASPSPDELHWWELQLGFALPNALYTEVATGP